MPYVNIPEYVSNLADLVRAGKVEYSDLTDDMKNDDLVMYATVEAGKVERSVLTDETKKKVDEEFFNNHMWTAEIKPELLTEELQRYLVSFDLEELEELEEELKEINDRIEEVKSKNAISKEIGSPKIDDDGPAAR